MSSGTKRGKLEDGLITALRAIDNQVAREMQRSPADRELHGVQKWQPFEKRVESISLLLLDAIADQEINLDSLLVMSQALSKALSLLTQDLGVSGLGTVRTEYCLQAANAISRDAFKITDTLKSRSELN